MTDTRRFAYALGARVLWVAVYLVLFLLGADRAALAAALKIVPSSRGIQDAELSELGEPARRVALDHERLVVDLGSSFSNVSPSHRN